MLYPLKFKPVYKSYIWGGRSLEKYGRELPGGEIAESWDLSCHPDGVSIVSNGSFEGIPFPELLKVYGSKLIGTNFPQTYIDKFPLLVKLIDANEKLSVQVHPDDEYAIVYEDGGLGKNEMWYVLSARPGARIVYGVVPGTTKEQFTAAIRKNNIESCLRYMEVSQGDVINIPAGVVHAIGEGILIAEIQQNSNTTYRVFDYNRELSAGKRPLHTEQALEVINFESSGKKEKSRGLRIRIDGQSYKDYVVANRYFAAELYDINGRVLEKSDGSKFYIYIFTEGEGEISYSDGKTTFKAGETVFIPALLGNYIIKGRFKALKAYIPDLQNDVVCNLKAAGYSKDSIYNIIAGIA
ncbi:MAG: mannose-6-phosphate isomerase, class I [Clostridia bacterium]|nr:mannose-6-phosphate isomerase, class I [Clostridia bacterium]